MDVLAQVEGLEVGVAHPDQRQLAHSDLQLGGLVQLRELQVRGHQRPGLRRAPPAREAQQPGAHVGQRRGAPLLRRADQLKPGVEDLVL